MSVIVRMKNGDTHHIRGYASEITEKINAGREQSDLLGGQMINLERDTIPTGNMMSLDPTEVSSVEDDRR